MAIYKDIDDKSFWENISSITTYMVVKDSYTAEEYDTPRYKHDAELYFRALRNTGTVTLFAEFYTFDMFRYIIPANEATSNEITNWIAHPYLIPEKWRQSIIDYVEPIVISNFEEKNEYYRILIGLPPYGTPESKFIFLDMDTYKSINIKPREINGVIRYPAVHEMSTNEQTLFISLSKFIELKNKNPDAKYLNFLGNYKINLEAARRAKDFEIIRLLPDIDPTINRSLLTEFSITYNKVRDYFVKILYNPTFEDCSMMYREFVGTCMMIKTIRLVGNHRVDSLITNDVFDDDLIAFIFDIFHIPSIKVSTDIKKDIVMRLPKLIRDKATNKVLYDICDVMGFDNVILSKVILLQQQIFDSTTGKPIFPTATINGQSVQDVYQQFDRFWQYIDIKSVNPVGDILARKNVEPDYGKIIRPDPRWWETQIDEVKTSTYAQNEADEVTAKVFHKRYNWCDSKYIQISIGHYMTNLIFEMLYFLRMLLDQKKYTDQITIPMPNYGKNRDHSIYDVCLFLVAGICQIQFAPKEIKYYDGAIYDYSTNTRAGEIINPSTNYKWILGFNFDQNLDDIVEYINNCEYIDKEVCLSYLNFGGISSYNDIHVLYTISILSFRNYLKTQIELSASIEEYREYNELYYMMFVYDAVREVHKKLKDPPPYYAPGTYAPPVIRYKLYDMQVMNFGTTQIALNTNITITVPRSINGATSNITLTVGRVVEVGDDGIPTKINFMYPNAIDAVDDKSTVVHMFNNATYNPSKINLEFDNNLDCVDQDTGEEIYGPIKCNQSDLTIGISTIKYHTTYDGNFYARYMNELVDKNPILYSYMITGDDITFKAALNEAIEMLALYLDVDIRYIARLVNGDESMVEALMKMIKYIKSYTIDFLTAAHRYVFNDKQTGDYYRIFDGFAPDGNTITIEAGDVLLVWDAFGRAVVPFTSVIQPTISLRRIMTTKTITKKGIPLYDRNPSEDPSDPLRLEPKISDAIIMHAYNNAKYKSYITDLKNISIDLPPGLPLESIFYDHIEIPKYDGNLGYVLEIMIYLGNEPSRHIPPYEDYVNEWFTYSGFMYNTIEPYIEDCPIYISIQRRDLPIEVQSELLFGLVTTSIEGHVTGFPDGYLVKVSADLIPE